MVTVLTNIAAVVAAIVAMIVVNSIVSAICNVLMQIPIISTLLSFPTTPQLYVLCAVDFFSILTGFLVSRKIAKPTKNNRKPAVAVVGAYSLLSFAVIAYSIFATKGFCDLLIVSIVAVLASGWMISAGIQRGGTEG